MKLWVRRKSKKDKVICSYVISSSVWGHITPRSYTQLGEEMDTNGEQMMYTVSVLSEGET